MICQIYCSSNCSKAKFVLSRSYDLDCIGHMDFGAGDISKLKQTKINLTHSVLFIFVILIISTFCLHDG